MPWSFDQVCSIIAAKAAEADRVSLFVAASALSDKELLAMNYSSEDEVMKFVEFKLQAGIAPAANIVLPSALKMAGRLIPATIARQWGVLQYSPDPPFNCHRPQGFNQGTPAALMHEVFGDFLDRARCCKIDAQSFLDFQALAPIMAASYEDPSSAAAQDTMAALGCNPIGMLGMPGGGEAARARNFRYWLEGVIARVSPASSAPCNLERIETGASDVKTDGSWVLPAAPSNPNCHVLLIVVKEGSDAGSPMFQLLSHYTQSVADALRRQAHTVLRTCFPTLAVEVCGDCFRVDALYYTDKPCCQPLTPFLHVADMRASVPGHTETVIRTLKALASSAVQLATFYQPIASSACAPAAGVSDEAALAAGLQARDLKVQAGIPYMLHSYAKVTRLRGQMAFLCEGDASDSSDSSSTVSRKLVAKLLPCAPTEYPSALHTEAAAKGCVPSLLRPASSVAGGFTLLRMGYLDPDEGWIRLDELEQYPADYLEVERAANDALARLHSCLAGTAVHGDLRPPNIFLRLVVETDSVEVKFVDLDWAGAQGVATYPLDINNAQRVPWPLQDPAGQAITQEHDRQLLAKSVASAKIFCRGSAKRARPNPPDASGAAMGGISGLP